MPRKNRVSVRDGVYHVTTRIAHRAMLLAPEEAKDRVAGWIRTVADFSGVEVWSFAVMDNHLHLIVHVPPVPRRYWLDPGVEPAAYAFGMRPPECRPALWPSDGACPPPRRPPAGFTLGDGEMVARLASLYGHDRAAEIGREWASLRTRGLDAVVDGRKERYCRRMYNLSQFLKTLKERVSSWYNETYGHEGSLWQGRFYSGVLERSREVLSVVAAYVAYNPVKADIARSPSDWRWSSYALAVRDAGEAGARCRAMYARMLSRPWEEARETLESIFADRLPDGVSVEELGERIDARSEEAEGPAGPARAIRASQAIRVTLKVFRTGAYIGRSLDFLDGVKALLPKRFPCAGARSVRRCRALD